MQHHHMKASAGHEGHTANPLDLRECCSLSN